MSEKEWVKVAVSQPNGQVHVVTKDSAGKQVCKTRADGAFDVSKSDFDELGPDGLKALQRATKEDKPVTVVEAAPLPDPKASDLAKLGVGQPK